ncbi:MAG TPA: hypothetical protein VI546_01895, partial [candidate division Zixibacteria bacterium]|nr:hypothetical protein [candidate division Zixibacteria bacterium]
MNLPTIATQGLWTYRLTLLSLENHRNQRYKNRLLHKTYCFANDSVVSALKPTGRILSTCYMCC